MNTLKMNFGEALSREQMKNVVGGYIPPDICEVAAPGEPTTSCQVKINGEWRSMGVVPGNGSACGQHYVSNGWASNWCCDSC